MSRYDGFRLRIVRLLRTTAWPGECHNEELLKKHAAALGVAPELLAEARRLDVEERRARGLKPTESEKTNERDYPQLEIDMPEVVWRDWHLLAERRHLHPNAMMRGLLQDYLLGKTEPATIDVHWEYKGKRYLLNKRQWEEAHHRAWPFRERVFVTRGATEALGIRAKRIHQSRAAILRGLVLELLAGKRMPRPLEARAMYDDPLRYVPDL